MAEVRNNSRFWVPILIMSVISVVSITSNIFLMISRNNLAANHERTIKLVENNVQWNIAQDTRIARMESYHERLDEKVCEILAILKEEEKK